MINLITEHIDIWTAAQEQKTNGGRGRGNNSNGQNFYGIKKLRELILELAVRGKLVPQDPNDEPASALLEKIRPERDQLIKEGKFKNIEEDRRVDSKTLFSIPKNWKWCRLNDIAAIARGGSPRPIKSYITDSPNGLNWIKIGDTDRKSRYIASTEEKIIKEGLIKTRVVYPGDLILSNSMSYGFPYILKIEGCIHDGWLVIRTPKKLVDKMYMCHLFLSMHAKKSFDSAAAGAVVQNLNADKVRMLTIPLPPLAEQHRIVAKVDELMALCDQLEQQQTDSNAAHQILAENLLATLTSAADQKELTESWQRIADNFDTLFTTEHSIDQLKQTILQLAVMGKLVPQDPNDEPASELLKKIAKEKARLMKEGKIKKQKPLPEISEDEKLFDLPEKWEWIPLGNMISIMDAGWSPACIPTPSPNIDTWGILKTTAVQIMNYLENENKELPARLEPRPQYEVKKGDILITRAGPKNRVGISCLVQETRPKLMISDKIIRFHLYEVGINEKYISLCLNAGATADYLEKAKSGMAESQMNISQVKLKAVPVPLCSLSEQHRIVTKVDELMTLCDALKARINNSQTTQIQLADAIVNQAVA